MTRSSHKVIFIDRDGVINRDPIGDYIKRWKDFKFLPGVIRALKKLSSRKYQIIIISNQAGIGDGVYPESSLKEITVNMLSRLEKEGVSIHSVYYCLHGKKEGCSCRKPKTLLFRLASKRLRYQKTRTYYIGDKVSDIRAGKRFGLKTMLVLTGHGSMHKDQFKNGRGPDRVFPSLREAVESLWS